MKRLAVAIFFVAVGHMVSNVLAVAFVQNPGRQAGATFIAATVRKRDLGNCGNHLPSDTDAFEDLVRSDLVCDQSKGRGKRPWTETRFWLWELSNGLGMAA